MDQKALTLENFMEGLERRNPGETEFHQAVYEVAKDLVPFIRDHPRYREAQILERMTEPDRVIIFRVAWQDDQCNNRINRGYRVQFSNAIGPYKGGLRFTRDLNLSVLKFLGFDQTFKNSLTTLPLGAAKGGANFNPKGKSDDEIMRFCQAYMTELYHYLGTELDIPAGDIGVGTREVSYLFGQYKRLTHHFSGVLTGKALEFGGSHIRKEATGYGCAYFMKMMLNHRRQSLADKRCAISGAGNVALHCAEKLLAEGAKVVTLSDSDGFVHLKDGLTEEQLEYAKVLKFQKRQGLVRFAEEFDLAFHEGKKPWGVPCDLAFPCATQNEMDEKDVKSLADNDCLALAEGANMPLTQKALDAVKQSAMLYGPGKAANAGGVAVSGLEIAQNATRLYWTAEEMDHRLQELMEKIHQQCLEHGEEKGGIDYARGANIAGFLKVAEAMMAYGVV